MKKAALLIIVLLCSIGLTMTGCSQFGYVVGVGPVVTTNYDYSNFSNVEISNSFEFDISQSDTYSITTSTHQNVVDFLDIYKSGNTLIVRLKNSHYASPNPKITVTMPELNNLIVSGASKGSIQGFKSTNGFELTASGASQLNMNIEAGATKVGISGASKVSGNLKSLDTKLTLSGASQCELKGAAGLTSIDVSGASQINSPDFIMRNADVNLSGASTVTVNTSGTLNLDVSGASTLNYMGNPILSKVNVSGASKINAK